MYYAGQLCAHSAGVTCLARPENDDRKQNVVLVSGSRDNTIIVWGIDEGKQDTSSSASAAMLSSSSSSLSKRSRKRRNKALALSAAEKGSSNTTHTTSSTTTSASDVLSLIPIKRLEGHRGFISDVAVSKQGDFVLSSSWAPDKSLRLWRTSTGDVLAKFLGHTNDVLCCALSFDEKYVVSGGRDCSIRVWNVFGICEFVFNDQQQSNNNYGLKEWISGIRFVPIREEGNNDLEFISSSWDGLCRHWRLQAGENKERKQAEEEEKSNANADSKSKSKNKEMNQWKEVAAKSNPIMIYGEKKQQQENDEKDAKEKTSSSSAKQQEEENVSCYPRNLNAVATSIAISPDASLVCSAHKSGEVKLWEVSSAKKLFIVSHPKESASTCVLAPTRFWVACALETRVMIYDLEERKIAAEVAPDLVMSHISPVPSALCFAGDSLTLYVAYNDNIIRCFCFPE